jgi:4-hydroxy-tetrahydrodipicolinate synthase
MADTIRGAFAPVPTPLTTGDELDLKALKAHLDWLRSEGLSGAVVLGTNGEFPSFTLDERRRVAEAAAEAGAGFELLLGVGSCALGEVREMLRLAGELGYAGALCPPPFYFRGAPVAGLADFMRRAMDDSPVPLLLYHIPQVTGVPFDDELLEAVGGHPMLGGVKDSSGSVEELERLTDRLRDRAYLVGNDRLVAECLVRAGTGSITACASVAPALVASIGRERGRQSTLTELRGLLEDYGLGAAVKAILRSKGFGDYATRPPLEALEADREQELLERFRAFG